MEAREEENDSARELESSAHSCQEAGSPTEAKRGDCLVDQENGSTTQQMKAKLSARRLVVDQAVEESALDTCLQQWSEMEATEPRDVSETEAEETTYDSEQQSLEGRALDLVVGPDVERLGVAFSTLPPEPVVVKRVTDGTWAHQQGIEAGDTFEAVNNQNVRELTGADFKTLLKQRPVTLRLGERNASFEELPAQRRKTVFDADDLEDRLDLVVDSDIKNIGLAFCTLPPNPLVVKRVTQGTWADENGVKEGDLCIAINGRSVRELDKQAFVDLMLERPLTLRLCSIALQDDSARRRKTVMDMNGGSLGLDLVVSKGIKNIGLAFCTKPPQPLVVKRVVEGTWADDNDVKEGDVFIAINGRCVKEMSKEECVSLMQKRPLTLRLGSIRDQSHEKLPERGRNTVFDTEVDSTRLDLVVGSHIKSIGIVFCTLPPRPLLVKRIMPGTWAYDNGVKEGDVFVAINGQPVDEMNKEEFVELMQKRPLALRMGLAEDFAASDDSQEGSSDTETTTSTPEVENPQEDWHSKVWLHVYDLRGNEGRNDAVIGMGFGVFHTGVEVHGVEWSFGYVPNPPPLSGVYAVPPRQCPLGTHRESICLGPARAHSAKDAWLLVQGLGAKWLGKEYHIIRHNCHHFCAELCEQLGVARMPGWVSRLAVAADWVLMPLLEALNVPVMPVLPSGEHGVDYAISSAMNEEMRERHSVATIVAVSFGRHFAWAFGRMLVTERQGRREFEQPDHETTAEDGNGAGSVSGAAPALATEFRTLNDDELMMWAQYTMSIAGRKRTTQARLQIIDDRWNDFRSHLQQPQLEDVEIVIAEFREMVQTWPDEGL